MAGDKAGILRAGLGLVWRRQRVLWYIYAVNFFLGLMGTLPLAAPLAPVLDRSLAADRLYRAFDLAVFAELVSRPEVSLRSAAPMSFCFALLFCMFMLFLTGGVLEAYQCDQAPETGDFFRACGAFFWRFARLLVCLVIVLVPIGMVASLLRVGTKKLSSEVIEGLWGFAAEVGAAILILFLLVAVRLWFDMAQVYAVAENEQWVRTALRRAFTLTRENFGQLVWIYLRISVLAWLGLLVAIWAWIKLVRPEWVGVSFLLGQGVLIWWLATRLWQRASEILWYQRYEPLFSADYLDKLVA